MKFPYRAYEVDATPASAAVGGYIYRPVIPFALSGPAGTLDFFGLLDTGADETYITRKMAERLGISVGSTATHVIDSAGGEVHITYCKTEFELTDGTESYRWSAVIGVSEHEWAEVILGHNGFLEFFDVLFRGDKHDLEIERNSRPLPNGR